MIYYLKLFLDKLLCKHKWEEMYSLRVYSKDIPNEPDYVSVVLCCSECGKIKKIIV